MSTPIHVQWDLASNKGLIVDIPNQGILFAAGVTVPTDATPGYLPGCIFIDVDKATGNALYINMGTAASCDFNVLYGGAAQGAALTTQLTTITHTAPGTPDYAVQDLINSNAYGFVTKDEGNTVLSAVANMQVRLAEVEARLEALGVVAAN